MLDERTQLFLMTGTTIALWGAWGFFGKVALDRGMSPLSIFYVEIFASLACVAGTLVITRLFPGLLRLPKTGGWNGYGVLSGLGLASGLLVYYLALYRGKAAVVVPLTALYPVVTTALSVVILRERMSLVQWAGLILVMAGALMLLYGPVLSAPATSPELAADGRSSAH